MAGNVWEPCIYSLVCNLVCAFWAFVLWDLFVVENYGTLYFIIFLQIKSAYQANVESAIFP